MSRALFAGVIRHSGFATLIAVTALLSQGCVEDKPKAMLDDTLHFEPGLRVTYKGKAARLYGDSMCSHGRLVGIACLIFLPDKTTATGTLLSGNKAEHVTLHAKRDPANPTHYLVVDDDGEVLIRTNGRNDDIASFRIVD